MAIGPQTNALIDSYKLKIEQKRKNKVQIEETKRGYNIVDSEGGTIARIEDISVVINRFTPAVNGLDTEILRINNLINDQQTLIDNLYVGATQVGCSTYVDDTTTVVTTSRDDVYAYSWSFSGNNPFVESNTLLTTSNIGVGTYTGIIVTSIGTHFALDGTCPGYADSITAAENAIVTLKAQRDPVLSSVQNLKEARAEYQLQQYGYDQATSQIDTKIAEAEAVITALESSDSQYYLE